MKIGELAARTNVSARSLRHYESAGLLESKRLVNGYREYSEWDAERVRKISMLLELGFSLKMILQLDPCLPSEKKKIRYCPKIKATLEKHRQEIKKRSDEMLKLISEIDEILAPDLD
jgi:DNA-binding transcriptional MerR regulator